MPGFDGTGPRGMGPMTGGGRGFCSPYSPMYGMGVGYRPGFGLPAWGGRGGASARGMGRGIGFGRGMGMGRGAGFGRGMGYPYAPSPYAYGGGLPYAPYSHIAASYAPYYSAPYPYGW